MSGRDGALLVLATTAKAALDEDHAGSVSEYVLSTLRQPVLLVGPRVDVDRGLPSPNLVVAVDGSGLDAVALPVIASWTRTFGGGTPTFVEVIPFVPAIAEHAGRALEAAHVRECVDRLATFGIEAGGDVIYGEEPASALADHAERVENARPRRDCRALGRSGHPLAQHEPQAGVRVEPAGARRPCRSRAGRPA